jgi:hypothetical protein
MMGKFFSAVNSLRRSHHCTLNTFLPRNPLSAFNSVQATDKIPLPEIHDQDLRQRAQCSF